MAADQLEALHNCRTPDAKKEYLALEQMLEQCQTNLNEEVRALKGTFYSHHPHGNLNNWKFY